MSRLLPNPRALAAAALFTVTVIAVGTDWPQWATALLGLAWFVLVVAVFDWLARQDRELADLEQLAEAEARRTALARCVHCGGHPDGGA